MDTDCTLSKRSFAQVASATFSCLHHSGCNDCSSIFARTSHGCCGFERVSPFKRRSISGSRTIMPVQTSPPSLPDSFPSFMSVFGGISSDFNEKRGESTTTRTQRFPAHVTVNTSRRFHPFRHRESVSSATSESTESSPTTTISTFDSPSVTDISPSSSPESPSSMPLSYSKFMPPARDSEGQSSPTGRANPWKQSSDQPNPMRPDSPGRRARNVKNLSLRMPAPSQSRRPSIATASVVETTSHHHLSAPPSPVHIPAKGTRRKPANLTIRTPGLDKSFSNIPEIVPPTPHGRQSLRHTESSPSLASIFSPSFAPKGGMQLPRPVTHHGSRRPSATSEDSFSPFQSVSDGNSIPGGILHELEEEDDQLDSRESTRRNERGYPDGPIRIYDSGLYLYLEPTKQEASEFDVVVNVAKEVVNPFTGTPAENDTVMSAWRNASIDPKRLSCGQPQTAISEASFKSAFEYLQTGGDSPATPKNEPSGPEYIHVGWDHNSEILDDLYPLCELIDSRIAQGKKVLVHCQLGVSRSASLVIAYGLYKNRHLDFNTMYGIVKERSRWVGPNMSLIYQLTDFWSRLSRGAHSKSPTDEGFSPEARNPEAQPSPLGSMGQAEGVTPRRSLYDSDTGRSSSNTFSQTSSLSSLSVPSTHPSMPTSAHGFGPPKSLSQRRSVSPRPLPLRQRFHSAEPARGPVKAESAVLPHADSCTSGMDLLERATSPSPAPFSPRTAGFLTTSLSRSLAGGLATNVPDSLGLGSQTADPRSPPQGNERLIMRNIDEFL